MKHVTEQNIVALTGIAGFCALAFLCLVFSPAVAATLSRGADFSTTLWMARSMIYPFCANKCRLPPIGASARRPIDKIIALFRLLEGTT